MKSFRVNLIFLPAREMKSLNQKYRKEDYTPNVLSFGGDLNEILIRWPLLKKEKLEELITHGIMNLFRAKRGTRFAKRFLLEEKKNINGKTKNHFRT